VATGVTEVAVARFVLGVRLPDPVGGHPALDFCNTRGAWGEPEPIEYLTGPRAVAAWAHATGLIPADGVADLPPTPVPREAHALRAAVRDCLLGTAQDAGWDLVGSTATAARAASRLRPAPPGGPAGGGAAGWVASPGPDPVRAAILAVAAAAEDLLRSPLAASVSLCRGRGCGFLFADPRGRRRWCTMAVCGNRAKSRAHSERRRVTEGR
jgi:predicted RNA-binding Zn ribbon-like protein